MIKTISQTRDTIIVVDETGVKTARADHPKWTDIQRVSDQISYVNGKFLGPTDELLALMDLRTVVESYTEGLLSVSTLGVTYAGRPLHTIDAERVMAFMRDKLNYKPIANYIARKMKNPSARAIQEMYNFLEHKGMPLTLRGTFIAYKGITNDFWSITGNKDTVVIQGEVDSQGRIFNKIGATIEVERSSVDDDFRRGCSHGLHAGSLVYASGWGQRVVLVEIDPADVVSVPDDCNCQKLRCCKYTVVGEYSGPMPDTLTTEFDSENEPDICHTCGGDNDSCGCEDGDEDFSDESECQDNAPATVGIPVDSQGQAEVDMTSGDKCSNCNHDKYMCTCNTVGEKTSDTKTCQNCTCDSSCSEKNSSEQPEPNSIFNRVVKLLCEQIGMFEDDIKPSTKMDSKLLSLDSLDGVEFVMNLEREFGFEISDEDAEKGVSSTVAEICNYIEIRLGMKQNYTATSDLNYIRGHHAGCADKLTAGSPTILGKPLYLKGDEMGADSQAHAQYILGYVAGYAGK